MFAKKTYILEYFQEPICECLRCSNVHLRKDRLKYIPEQPSKFLCIYVCPKCKNEKYVWVGDKELKRRVVDE